ncbi:MAG: hypothetical protein ABFD63_10920 [Smithella sp.]|jgi:hypothetical protein
MDQRFVNTNTHAHNFHKRLTHSSDFTAPSCHFQSLTKHQFSSLQFFRQRMHGLCLNTASFVSLPGMLAFAVASGDQSARSGF